MNVSFVTTQISIAGIFKDCWKILRLVILSSLLTINECKFSDSVFCLFDPMFFHSDGKFGGKESLLGSGITFFGGGCNGNLLGWYPWNSNNLFNAVR